jgi:hypothetical protein
VQAVLERVLDWRPFHDERSLDHPVRDRLPDRCPRRRRMWRAGRQLDQGFHSGSVGYGWTTELQAEPSTTNISLPAEHFAMQIYRQAQQVDDFPGETIIGTSVLAAAKALQEGGYITSYTWAFNINDVIDAVVEIGPVVVGIPWFESMSTTRTSGMVEVNGRIVGGHCVTITGYDPALQLTGESTVEALRWRNSWGATYGAAGDGYVRAGDLERLLWGRYGSEACIPFA